MSELKTKVTKASVAAFLKTIDDDRRRADCSRVLKLMKEATGVSPKMWGESIVGFGSYNYRYASGQKGEWPIIAFSPRKGDLTLYLMPGFQAHAALMSKLGEHKTGRSCLYIKRLDDIDLSVLNELIVKSVETMRSKYGAA